MALYLYSVVHFLLLSGLSFTLSVQPVRKENDRMGSRIYLLLALGRPTALALACQAIPRNHISLVYCRDTPFGFLDFLVSLPSGGNPC